MMAPVKAVLFDTITKAEIDSAFIDPTGRLDHDLHVPPNGGFITVLYGVSAPMQGGQIIQFANSVPGVMM